MNGNIKRGDIYYADLSPVVGCEQDGVRPVLILQNNRANKYSPTVIAAAITSREKPNQSTHVHIGTEYGLDRNSYVMLEQIRTIDKIRLREFVGQLDDDKMQEINQTLYISFDLADEHKIEL